MAGRVATPARVRFDEKCRVAESGCIEWTAATGSDDDYGRFYFEGRMHLAHRWNYEQTHGRQPAHIDVCHACDNEICVRLSHLFAGTRKQNMEDAVRKGRTSHVARTAGEGHPMAKIDERMALSIRASSGRVAQIAEAHGTTYMIAWRIINRLTWRHLP